MLQHSKTEITRTDACSLGINPAVLTTNARLRCLVCALRNRSRPFRNEPRTAVSKRTASSFPAKTQIITILPQDPTTWQDTGWRFRSMSSDEYSRPSCAGLSDPSEPRPPWPRETPTSNRGRDESVARWRFVHTASKNPIAYGSSRGTFEWKTVWLSLGFQPTASLIGNAFSFRRTAAVAVLETVRMAAMASKLRNAFCPA